MLAGTPLVWILQEAFKKWMNFHKKIAKIDTVLLSKKIFFSLLSFFTGFGAVSSSVVEPCDA